MILESDTETTPSPLSGKTAADMDAIHDDGMSSSEQRPPIRAIPEPQGETPEVGSHENQVAEIPIPPVPNLSPASPQTKPNPFTASKIFIHPPGALPPHVRSTVLPDIACLSLHPFAVHDTRGRGSTVASQAPGQESPTQTIYVFSAAEIHTLVASRGSDEGSGPNNLAFHLDWGLMNGISKWRNFKAGQG